MSMKEKILGIFGKALDEALVEETEEEKAARLALEAAKQTTDSIGDLKTMLTAITTRLDALEKPPAKIEDAKPVVIDTDTLALAEILSPGIAKTPDIKVVALDSAYKTQDGKEVIDSILNGLAFDESAKSNAILFSAAAELMKEKRRQKFSPQTQAIDSLKRKIMTGDELQVYLKNYRATDGAKS